MKAKLNLLVAMAFLVLGACTETTSDEFCNDPGATCPDNSQIEATSCCTDTDCYWVYNGSKYNCDGDDCTAAINTIVNSACINASINFDLNVDDYEQLKAQMQALTSQLLLEARAASGCGY